MSDYIQKLSQMKKDIGIIQDSLFFEMHNLEQEIETIKAKLKATEDRLGEAKRFAEESCLDDCALILSVCHRKTLEEIIRAQDKRARQYLLKYKEGKV